MAQNLLEFKKKKKKKEKRKKDDHGMKSSYMTHLSI